MTDQRRTQRLGQRDDGGALCQRDGAGALVYQQPDVAVGGDPIQGHYQNDVWCSADGTNWQEVPDTPWIISRSTACAREAAFHVRVFRVLN